MAASLGKSDALSSPGQLRSVPEAGRQVVALSWTIVLTPKILLSLQLTSRYYPGHIPRYEDQIACIRVGDLFKDRRSYKVIPHTASRF